MHEPSKNSGSRKVSVAFRPSGWLIAWLIVGIGLVFVGGSSAWAGVVADRLNQTVPLPTPTGSATPVPTVTPTFTPIPPTDTPVPPTATDTPAPPEPTATPAPTHAPGETPPTPSATETPTPEPTETPTAEPTATPTEEATPTPAPDFALEFQMAYQPAFPLQGDQLTIAYAVTNPADVTVHNARVRNLLPADLILVTADAVGGEPIREIDSGGGTVILFAWDAIEPGQTMRAQVVVEIAADTPDGAVLDNLAVAFADNALPRTAGISIGMPPALLPTFNE